MRTIPRSVGLFCVALSGIAAIGFAQRTATPAAASTAAQADATARIVRSAQALLNVLDDAERVKVQFAFDSPQRAQWSNLPSPMFQRNGLRLADATPAQRAAVMSLLSVALSRDGYRKVTEIMRGD